MKDRLMTQIFVEKFNEEEKNYKSFLQEIFRPNKLKHLQLTHLQLVHKRKVSVEYILDIKYFVYT